MSDCGCATAVLDCVVCISLSDSTYVLHVSLESQNVHAVNMETVVLQAAENAVAQSSREIGGYPVASISMTADRIAHYQAVSGGGEEIQQMFQDVEPAHPFAVSLLSLFPQLAAIQSQQAGLPAMGADSITHGHKQVCV